MNILIIYENDLIRKLRLILKVITSQTGKQIITLHMLANISQEAKAIRQ